MDTVIFDIDNTIADLGHRLHLYVKGGDNTEFYVRMDEDLRYDHMFHVYLALRSRFHVVFVTGRAEDHRHTTRRWLIANGFYGTDQLFMRSAGDHRPACQVKRDLLDQVHSFGYTPFLAIEDEADCVLMYREQGLTCLQPREYRS